MRKAIMGVGALLIVVGLVQLILSIVMVGGIAGGIKAQVKGLDPVLEDATSMLTEVADTVDGAVGFLKDMDTTLGNAEKTVGDTLDNTSKGVGNLDATLGDFDATLADLGETVSDTTDAVTSVQDAIKAGIEQLVVEITADDLAYWAVQVEYAGYDSSWFEVWADYLKAEGMTLSVSAEVEITAADLENLAAQMEYAGYDVTAIRAEAARLEKEGLVWSLTADDVTGIFTPVAETLDIASDSLSDASDGLADVSGLLGTVQTSLTDVKGLAAGAISDVRGYLTTAQTDLGDIGSGLRTVTTDIKGIDVGDMIGGAVDQVVSPLKMYMIFSSILFMLAGAGFLLVGIRKTEV